MSRLVCEKAQISAVEIKTRRYFKGRRRRRAARPSRPLGGKEEMHTRSRRRRGETHSDSVMEIANLAVIEVGDGALHEVDDELRAKTRRL